MPTTSFGRYTSILGSSAALQVRTWNDYHQSASVGVGQWR